MLNLTTVTFTDHHKTRVNTLQASLYPSTNSLNPKSSNIKIFIKASNKLNNFPTSNIRTELISHSNKIVFRLKENLSSLQITSHPIFSWF